MKKLLLCAAIPAIFALNGCGPAPDSAEVQADRAAGNKQSQLGQIMDKGIGVETDSNIKSINTMIGSVKADNDGKAPETIEEAKRISKMPEEKWIDQATGKPFVYDPATGTVSKAP